MQLQSTVNPLLIVEENQRGNPARDDSDAPRLLQNAECHKESDNNSSISTYFSISTFSMIGCLIRVGLGKVFGSTGMNLEGNGTPLLETFVSNMVGSFISGLLAGSTLVKHPQMQSLSIGLSAGLSSSITAFSTFNQQTSLVLIGEISTIGNNLFTAVAAIVIGVLVPVLLFIIGHDISTSRQKKTNASSPVSKPSRPLSLWLVKAINLLSGCVFVGLWTALLAVSIRFSRRRYVSLLSLSAVMAPFGAILRFLLSKCNTAPPGTTLQGQICTGTFLANYLGSLLVAVIHFILTWCTMTCTWGTALLAAQIGFCGCLTTMSALASEIYAMRFKGDLFRSYCYPFLMVVICELTACAVNGISAGVQHHVQWKPYQNGTCI